MNSYQYIGTNYNLEPLCIQESEELREPSTIEECCELMQIAKGDAEMIFPRAYEGYFYTSSFDNIPCVTYELLVGSGIQSKVMQFIWIRMD